MMGISVFKKNDARRVKSPWCCKWTEIVDGKKRKREKHFATKLLAEDFAATVKGRAGQLVYTSADQRVIDYVWALCLESELGLIDVVHAGLDVLDSKARGPARKVPTIEWAIEGFYEEGKKRNIRPATLRNRHTVMDPFMVGRGDRLITTLTTDEILAYVLAKYDKEGSRDSLVGVMKAFYNWCAAKGQEWVEPMKPKALTWTASIQDKVRPMVYTAEETAALLGSVSDKLKAAVAIGLFAGVRPEELRRIQWSWTDARGDWFGIDMKRRKIELSGQWTKTRRPRTLHDLPDNLWRWLDKYPGIDALVAVTERNWYRNINKAKTAAGIRKTGNDIMRHSFGSHGRHRGLDWTVDTLGHTEGMDVFNEHYNNNSIGPEDADRYFSIVPE